MRERWHALLEGAPSHLDVCAVPDKARLLRLLRAYEPDLGLCLGYRWRLSPEVLAIPRLGVVNSHPSVLPRWRGPFPVAWAVRERDPELGLTVHLMDEDFDTGPILAQGSLPMPAEPDWATLEPCFAELLQTLLPRALDRLARDERGEPQSTDGATYAGPFPASFSELDLAQPAAVVQRHVASWRFTFAQEGGRGPLTTLAGRRVRILRASLTDPGAGAPRLQCADGPLWVPETEPA